MLPHDWQYQNDWLDIPDDYRDEEWYYGPFDDDEERDDYASGGRIILRPGPPSEFYD